jgi:hypothetical protein
MQCENGVLRWFGHVERMRVMKGLQSIVFNGSVEGVRGKSRPKNSWLGVVDKCLKSKNTRSIN